MSQGERFKLRRRRESAGMPSHCAAAWRRSRSSWFNDLLRAWRRWTFDLRDSFAQFRKCWRYDWLLPVRLFTLWLQQFRIARAAR